jgi:hypothetical protein
MAATDDELLLESASLIETSDEGSYVAHDSLAGLPVYNTIHRCVTRTQHLDAAMLTAYAGFV